MRLKILLVLSVLIVVASSAPRVKRIVGGAPFEPGSYPFSVSLWYMGDNNVYTARTPDRNHICGGSLVDKDWVLTSAVCFDDKLLPGMSNLSNWLVVLGMYNQVDAEEEAQFLIASDVFYSPEYNMIESYGDIALLKLSSSANLKNPRIATVKYNSDLNCPMVGQRCTIVGWGQITEEPFGNGSYVPNAANVEIQDKADCSANYQREDVQKLVGPIRIDEGSICAGVRPDWDKDACHGDSGGPLLCQCGVESDLLVVATSTTITTGCARPGFSGVYANVGYFSTWIRQTIADN